MLLAACADPPSRGVYRSGANAVVRGVREGEIKVWGPDGTHTRSASPAPAGNSFVGQAGALWIVDSNVPAPVRAPPVTAVLVERAGFRLQEVLGTQPSGSPDAARAGGVYVRSTVKVRRAKAPPVYLVTATVDPEGAGRVGGPADRRSGAACRGAVAVVDDDAAKLLWSQVLEEAEATCAVPVLLPPVDREGDGGQDVLVYGQLKNAGFRRWFSLDADGSLVAGERESWLEIPQ